MAVSSGSIDVRITPGLGRWQAVLLAAVLVACLLIGFIMGRVTAPGGCSGAASWRSGSRVGASV